MLNALLCGESSPKSRRNHNNGAKQGSDLKKEKNSLENFSPETVLKHTKEKGVAGDTNTFFRSSRRVPTGNSYSSSRNPSLYKPLHSCCTGKRISLGHLLRHYKPQR